MWNCHFKEEAIPVDKVSIVRDISCHIQWVDINCHWNWVTCLSQGAAKELSTCGKLWKCWRTKCLSVLNFIASGRSATSWTSFICIHQSMQWIFFATSADLVPPPMPQMCVSPRVVSLAETNNASTIFLLWHFKSHFNLKRHQQSIQLGVDFKYDKCHKSYSTVYQLSFISSYSFWWRSTAFSFWWAGSSFWSAFNG
mgnify:CR=1 FL=1